MRWLFLFLLMLNIGYMAWELNRERPQHVTKTRLPDGVQPIVLLSELDTDKAAPLVTASAEIAEIAPQVVPDSADVPVSVAQPRAEERAAEIASTAAFQDVTTTDAAPAAAEPEVSAQPEPGLADLSAERPAEDLCYTLGPFSEMKTLRVVTREIRDYVVEASFRSKEEQEQTRFRVYIRPVASKQAAKAVIKELNSKNIKDHFIITKGEHKNGISLGYFSGKNRAYRYADRVRKLGFDAVAEPVFRSYTIYWLDYRIKAGKEIPPRIFDEHLENAAQKLSRSCS